MYHQDSEEDAYYSLVNLKLTLPLSLRQTLK